MQEIVTKIKLSKVSDRKYYCEICSKTYKSRWVCGGT